MEPVTHFLTGACIGRAGFNRKTAYATLAAVLAAEAADLDIIWGFAGPVEELKHHRGITHTFWAVPVVAGVVVGAVWLLDRWLKRRRRHEASVRKAAADPSTRPGTPGLAQDDNQLLPLRMTNNEEVRWGWLYLTACVAALSHLLLDWTNNYGVRPFFPFNPRWYAGSFMFIAEPVMWALLFLALFMPWVLGLADREIGARKQRFRGRGWAIFALCGMLMLGCWRWAEHAQALVMIGNAPISTEPALRAAAEPYPVNPFRWHAIVETPNLYQTAEVNTRTGSIDSDPLRDVLYKPADTAAVEAAKRTGLGKVYLDWGTWAVVRDVGPEPIPGAIQGLEPPNLPPGRAWTTVEFSDLRFDYSFLAKGGTIPGTAGHAPLSGWVYIVDGHEDAGEVMNGREQR
ncbi:MAG TPA: metal-dependent hydrolase [Terracidiphilus sp.]|nr:metal-dependent hydrolase [Terracidiphilus sp.]